MSFLKLDYCLVLTLFAGLSAIPVRAQDPTPVEQAAAARQQALQFRKQQATLSVELKNSHDQLTQLKSSFDAIVKSQATLQHQLMETSKKLETQAGEAAESTKKQEAALKVENEAKAILETAQKNYNAALAALEVSQKEVATRSAVVKVTQAELAKLKQQDVELVAAVTKSKEMLQQYNQQLAAHTEKLEASRKAESAQWQRVETFHQQAGSWISFSDQIAPVLHQRCLACHNSGKPRGQLVMDSYDHLLRGGESGQLVDLDAPELSTLVAMLEDGSMPKDDDPLSSEQIALIRNWVSQGARLGTSGNSSAPLIELMPRPQHPLPPNEYAIPIPVNAVALSPAEDLVVTSGYHELLVWSLENGTLTKRLSGLAERVYDIEFQRDSNRVAVAAGTPGEVGEVKILDLSTGQLVKDLAISATVFTGLNFSPDGSQLAVYGVNGKVDLYETQNWSRTLSIQEHSDWINALAWSPDGTRFVTASRDKTAKLFDTKTGQNLVTFNGHNAIVSSITFLANGVEIASGGEDRRLRVWKSTDASEIRNVTGFGSDLTAIIPLADEKLVTTSVDQKLRLHSSADSKIEKILSGPNSSLLCLAVNHSGTLVVTGSLGGEITLWSLESGAPVRSWKAQPSPQPEPASAIPAKE